MIAEKGLSGFEDFVLSRYQMYMNIYHNKTVVGIKWLLQRALNEVLGEEAPKLHTRKALTESGEFRDFTDSYFWEQFRHHARENSNSCCALLTKRGHLKHIWTGYNLGEKARKIKKAQLKDKATFDVVFQDAQATFSKFELGKGNLYEDFRVLEKSGALEFMHLKTDFFKKYQSTHIFHFYEEPNGALGVKKGPGKEKKKSNIAKENTAS